MRPSTSKNQYDHEEEAERIQTDRNYSPSRDCTAERGIAPIKRRIMMKTGGRSRVPMSRPRGI